MIIKELQMSQEYPIFIEQSLTSYAFYNNVLKQLGTYLRTDGISPVVFDFSNVTAIDGAVLPNLLCVGNILKQYNGRKPILDIPETPYGTKIKSYLSAVNFDKISEIYNIFELRGIFGNFDNLRLADECKLFGFEIGLEMYKPEYLAKISEIEAEAEKIGQYIYRTFKKKAEAEKMEKMQYYYLESNEYSLFNDANYDRISKITGELVKNIFEHNCFCENDSEKKRALLRKNKGKTAFVLCQVNESLGIIKFSVADCGVGYYDSFLSKNAEKESDYQTTLKKDIIAAEKSGYDKNLCGIAAAIFYRKEGKIFGIDSATKVAHELGATIRIHSNSTQIIMTSSVFNKLKSGINVTDFIKNISNMQNNFRSNLSYPGVHIEIEIPLKEYTK